MRVKVRAVLSFNDVGHGDEAWLPLTARVEALVKIGYLKIIEREESEEPDPFADDVTEGYDGGEDHSGQSGSDEGGDSGVTSRRTRRRKTSGEQGEGSGTG